MLTAADECENNDMVITSPLVLIRDWQPRDTIFIRELYERSIRDAGTTSDEMHSSQDADAVTTVHPAVARYLKAQLSGPLRNSDIIASRLQKDARLWVACAGENIIGMVGATTHSSHSASDGGDVVVELQYLCVSPQVRRKGIGSMLCSKVVDYAKYRKEHISCIVLETLPQLAQAVHLYHKLGFQRISERVLGKGTGKFSLLGFELVIHGRTAMMTAPSKVETSKTRSISVTKCGTTDDDRTAKLWKTGQVVLITHAKSGVSSQFLVEVEKEGANGIIVKLAPKDQPYHRLSVAQNGKVGFGSKNGRFSSFGVICVQAVAPTNETHTEHCVAFQSMGNLNKTNRKGGSHWFVGLSETTCEMSHEGENTAGVSTNHTDLVSSIPQLMFHDGDVTEDACHFLVSVAKSIKECSVPPTATSVMHKLSGGANATSASTTECGGGHTDIGTTFRKNGCHVLRNVVPNSIVSQILGTINAHIGEWWRTTCTDSSPNAPALPTCAEESDTISGQVNAPSTATTTTAVMQALHLCPELAVRLQALLNASALEMVDAECRLDLAFPGQSQPCSAAHALARAVRNHGPRMQRVAIVGVCLSDARAPACGNVLVQGANTRANTTTDDGMVEQEQMFLGVGDIVCFTSDMISHHHATNNSPQIRYMVFFPLAYNPAVAGVTVRDNIVLEPYARVDFARRTLSVAQIETFARDGVLVVPNVLSTAALARARQGLDATMRALNVDPGDLEGTAEEHLSKLSSTGGAGGVLDIFYPDWKLDATLDNTLYYNIITDLYSATYATNRPRERQPCKYTCEHTTTPCEHTAHSHVKGGAADSDSNATTGNESTGTALWAHPYEAFDGSKAFAHIDRIGYRIPDTVAKHMGKAPLLPTGRRHDAIQRGLAPHLDCCPTAMHNNNGQKQFPRWRPIQCMLALTDALHPDQGGFECCKGFHRKFDTYYTGGRGSVGAHPPSSSTHDYTSLRGPHPIVCVGDFTPIQPKIDKEILRKFEHIPVPAGAAVFWDQRIPHANARHNTASVPRAVIYGGFLPRTELNAAYAREQLRRFHLRLPQPDFWMEEKTAAPPTGENSAEPCALSALGQLLVGETDTLETQGINGVGS